MAPGSLIGRDAEVGRLAALLDDAAAGRSAALLLHGEPGIGKTALLARAADVARERGVTVLRAAGVEAEADLPFAGLSALLAPVLDLRARLPAAQARALGAALSLEPPEEQPRFVVGAATAGLLAAAAEDGPLVALVDDAHWLDEESLQAILFAVRRLEHDRLAVLLAARPLPERGLLGARLPELALERLGRAAVTELLRRALPDEPAPAALEALVAAAAGNPLAAVELPRALGRDALGDGGPLPEPLRLGATGEAAFRVQLDALPEPGRRALAVPAADPDAPAALILAALATLDLEGADLDAAIIAGLMTFEPEPGGAAAPVARFRHPLLRSAAYHGATAAWRRAVHRALAHAHQERGAEHRAAWHLAAAATGPDEAIAAQLDRAGADARERGALSLAANAARRAAELSPDPPARARRMLAAARDLAATERPEQVPALVESALPSADDPLLRADLQRVRGEVLIRLGRFAEAADLLAAESDRVAPADPARAARMLLAASVRHRATGAYATMDAETERAGAIAAALDPDVAVLSDIVRAHALIIGGGRRAGRALLDKHEALFSRTPSGTATLELLASPAHASIWTEDHDRADRITGVLVGWARERSAPAAVLFPLGIRAQLHFRRGDWAAAHADAEEAAQLAEDTRQLALVAYTSGVLAEIEAAMGLEEESRRHAGRTIALCDPAGADAIGMYGRAALGLLGAGLGGVREALDALDWCRAASARIGMVEPSVVHWAGSAVELLVRAGRTEDAAQLVGQLERAAAGGGDDAPGGGYAAGCAARGRGLLAPDDAFAPELERSVAILERAGLPFEAARSRLALGERLRRARKRGDARVPLRAALDAFERLGARPWARRAEAELRASGLAIAAQPDAPAAGLTPNELRVARLVAAGRSNVDVAAELFISRKTVEFHLSAVYRKLGLRSRTELAGALNR